MTLFLQANMQNRISFESLWHRKGDESCRESITQLHRTQWAKNRISGPKIENRLWKPEKHFQIKTNAHFGYNETQWVQKIGRYSGTKWLLHSVMRPGERWRPFPRKRPAARVAGSGTDWSWCRRPREVTSSDRTYNGSENVCSMLEASMPLND